MAMPAQPTEWTVEMVRALPDDGNRYEVVDGELFVTPAPSLIHQRAILELAYLLGPYLRDQRLGRRVERWRPNDSSPETLSEKLAWQPDRFAEPLVIDLAVYFGRVLGEPSREA